MGHARICSDGGPVVWFFPKQQELPFPGPQRQRFLSIVKPSVLSTLVLIFAVIIVVQLLEYYGCISGSHRGTFPLSIDKSIAIFCSLLALSFAVKNFALSVRPILSYEYLNDTESKMSLEGDVFQVLLKNPGPGMGVVVGASYVVKLREDSRTITTEDPNCVVDHMRPAKLFRHLNYDLFIMRPGYSIGSKESRPLFEIALQDAIKIEVLDVRLRIRSVLGDEYEKWLFCIPRDFRLSLPMHQKSERE